MWLLHSNLVGVVIFRGSLRTFEHTLKINYGETCMIFISRLLLKNNCTVSYVIDTRKAGLKMCIKEHWKVAPRTNPKCREEINTIWESSNFWLWLQLSLPIQSNHFSLRWADVRRCACLRPSNPLFAHPVVWNYPSNPSSPDLSRAPPPTAQMTDLLWIQSDPLHQWPLNSKNPAPVPAAWGQA